MRLDRWGWFRRRLDDGLRRDVHVDVDVWSGGDPGWGWRLRHGLALGRLFGLRRYGRRLLLRL